MANPDESSFEPPSRRSNVACPRCGESPFPGEQWVCAPDGCGCHFDTFATRARCPRCQAQFSVTWCTRCGVASRHEAWYRSSQ
jgi:hypothetical protein